MRQVLLAVTVATLGVACSENPVDIGDEGAGGTTSASEALQTWEGYVDTAEDWKLTSDRIILEDHGDGTGALMFGTGAPLEPPTDPDVGYPEDLGYSESEHALFPIERFEYHVSGLSIDSLRMQFDIDLAQVWRDWCALVPPHYDSYNDDYACIPNNGFGWGPDGCVLSTEDGTGDVPVDCGKLYLCDSVCQCSVDGCVAPQWVRSISLARTDDRLDGPIEHLTVHLAEQ
jgi:hypothetical protein